MNIKSGVSIGSAQEIALRLEQEIKRLGGVSAVARQAGVHRNTLASWISSGDLSTTDLSKLREVGVDDSYVAFGERSLSHLPQRRIPAPPGLPMQWVSEIDVRDRELRFLGMDESGEITEARIPLGKEDNEQELQRPGRFDAEFVGVPFYDELEVAAGHGRAILDGSAVPRKINHYRRSYLSRRGLTESALLEVVVSGDSMVDELRNGDTVLVDRGDTRIRGGAIFVFRQGDDLLVKYLQQLPGDQIQVVSENQIGFPSYVIERADIESGAVEIVGRVVRQGRDR